MYCYDMILKLCEIKSEDRDKDRKLKGADEMKTDRKNVTILRLDRKMTRGDPKKINS